MPSDLPQFDEGERLRLRGHEYVVDSIDWMAHDRDRVLQYRLERVSDDAPPATLKTGHDAGKFALRVHYMVEPDEIGRPASREDGERDG